jgi:uncharacterized protein with GYD domain
MIFIVQGCYTREALAGMAAAPEDRAKEARKLIEAAGGKFIASYFTLGKFDFIVISEFEDLSAVTPALIAAASGGSLSSMQTTVGMSWDDARAAFAASGKLGKSFRSAGKRGKK